MNFIEHLNAFLAKTKKYLNFIVRECRNEFTVADLHNDVWVIVLEIADERGSPVDLSDAADQALVRSKLYWHRVKREEKHSRYAVRLDAPINPHESDSCTLGEVISAPLSQSPEHILLNRETDLLSLSRLLSSYSQSTAYTLTLRNFEPDLTRLADYLSIARCTLKLHIQWADQHKKRQDSLFDQIEKIAEDFYPHRKLYLKVGMGEFKGSDENPVESQNRQLNLLNLI